MFPQSSKQTEAQPVTSEINEQVSPLIKKITENLKQIGIVFGAIILVAAGVTGYRYYRIQSLEKGRAQLGSIMLQADPGQRAVALEDFLSEAPKKMRPAIRLQLASQAMDSGQHQLAAKYWESIASKTDNPDLRVIARIGLAKTMHLQGQSAKGLKALNQLSQQAPERYREQINQALANMAEAAGDWNAALQAYERLKSDSGLTGGNSGYLKYKINQLQQKTGQGKSS